jgi:hypothetical protein
MLQVIKTKPTIINKPEMKNKIYTLSIIAIFFIGIACSPMPEVQVAKFGQVSFAGGNGSSYKNAILIENAKNFFEGRKAVNHYLKERFGEQGTKWVLFSKGHKQIDNKEYDVLEIALEDSKKTKIIYFDVTGFYGKY